MLDIKPYLPYADSVADASVPRWVVAPPVPSLASVCIADAAMLQMRSAKFDFFSGGEEFALALKQVRLLRSKILRQLACVRGVVPGAAPVMHACHHCALPASTSLLIIAAAAFKLRGHPQREHAEQPEVGAAGQSLHV